MRLETWLLTEGRCVADIPTLLRELGARMPGVERIWCGTKVLHPQAAAYLWIWEEGRPGITRELSYARFATLRQGDSPVRRLERGAPFVRFRPGDGETLPVVTDLWESDYTELYGLSFTLRGVWAGGVTWATRAPGGFTEAQRADLDALMPVLSAVIEPLANDLVMRTLLQTYLGQDAGERVHRGAVKRGDGTTVRAVVWFSDVRGFTKLSSELERDALLELLNDGFEQVVGALEAEGGQVLKFMGDGLLGIFTDEDGTAAERAARAASDLRVRMSAMRARRSEAGLRHADVGVGLHYGDVSYGNIGAPGRLDFTVIGAAVNLASRVEGLCGQLARPILGTRSFVDRLQTPWTPCGAFQVKGVGDPVEVFTPPPAASAPAASPGGA